MRREFFANALNFSFTKYFSEIFCFVSIELPQKVINKSQSECQKNPKLKSAIKHFSRRSTID